MWGALSHENVMPLLGLCETMVSGLGVRFVFVAPSMEHGTLPDWRKKVNPPGVEVRDRVSPISPLHG